MNLCHTDTRNRLGTEEISNLLMISINGPPLELWTPKKYVISWLKNGKRGALDKDTGIKKNGNCVGSFCKIVFIVVFVLNKIGRNCLESFC